MKDYLALLDDVGAKVGKGGYLVDEQNQRVLTIEGEEMNIKNYTGALRMESGSVVLVAKVRRAK